MPRKLTGSNGASSAGTAGAMPAARAELQAMTTAPAFDRWLEGQIKTLFAACADKPNQALLDLIHAGCSQPKGEVTD